MYSIGEIISSYRKKKGLLQQDLADELAKEGVTISYKAISNWERNLAEPSVTIFYKVCRILGITNMYEAYFGVNPADPLSSLTDEGREKAMDYIHLLHASGMYEKQTAKIIPFRSIDIFENAVSAGTGSFLVDGPKETVRIDESGESQPHVFAQKPFSDTFRLSGTGPSVNQEVGVIVIEFEPGLPDS